MDSCRVEKKSVMTVALADEDAEIEPVPADTGGRKPEAELDRLSSRSERCSRTRSGRRSASGTTCHLGRSRCGVSEPQGDTPHMAPRAHDKALADVMQHLLKEDTQLHKQFVENESFGRYVGDMVYSIESPSLRQSPGP